MTASLPPSAARKLADIEAGMHDAEALAHGMLARIRELESALANAVNNRDPQAADIEHEIARCRARHQARRDRHANDAQTVSQLRHWLQRLPANAVLEPIAPAAMPSHDDPVRAVQAQREQIVHLNGELQRLARAPLPPDDLKAQARQYVQALAERGRPAIEIERGQFTVRWRRRQDATSPGMTGEDVAAFHAWLDPAAMAARLEAEVAALPADPDAISAAAKAAQEAALRAKLLQVQRQEEAIIEAALARGQDMLRRPNADPRAILGVNVREKRARAAAA